jgi:PDZ domain-containing protein
MKRPWGGDDPRGGLGSIDQRGLTVLVGLFFVIVLTILAGQARVPYVALEPGPTYNTLGQDDTGKDVIVLQGATATASAGQLRFVTISVQRDLNLLQALAGWWRDDDAVVPKELIYPPNQTEQEVEKRNAQDFADSQSAAETAAFVKLGYKTQLSVKEISPNSAADGKLKPGDVINSIDGVAVEAGDKLVETLRAKPAGTTFTFGITRAGIPGSVQLTTVAGDDGVPRVGVVPTMTSTAPFKVDIPIENIGGPSAGLMLALGIIDKVQPEDLTGGKIIAGTGTIDPAGTVGPIGGIPQKLVASKAAKAMFFLTPKDNCAEATANAQPGLPLVQVGTLDEALSALADIRAGRLPPLCPGSG